MGKDWFFPRTLKLNDAVVFRCGAFERDFPCDDEIKDSIMNSGRLGTCLGNDNGPWLPSFHYPSVLLSHSSAFNAQIITKYNINSFNHQPRGEADRQLPHSIDNTISKLFTRVVINRYTQKKANKTPSFQRGVGTAQNYDTYSKWTQKFFQHQCFLMGYFKLALVVYKCVHFSFPYRQFSSKTPLQGNVQWVWSVWALRGEFLVFVGGFIDI